MKKNIRILCLLFLNLSLTLRAQNTNKIVGIGYSVWHDYFNRSTVYYHDRTLNPGNVFGDYSVPHWWGHPSISSPENYKMMINGNPDNPNATIIDSHADLLYAANVDFIALDLTNGEQPQIWDGAMAVCKRYTDRYNQGKNSPKIVFFVQSQNGIDKFIDSVYNVTSKYNQNIFFKYMGSPMILASTQLSSIPTGSKYSNFSIIKMWGLLSDVNSMWSYKQNVASGVTQGDYPANEWPEEMSVCAATQKNYMLNEANTSLQANRIGRYDTGYTGGTYWEQQWNYVNKTNPSFVFIWSWNEWVSQNLGTASSGKFVDNYTVNYAADIEPSQEAGDTLYNSLISKVSTFKRNKPYLIFRNATTGTWSFKFYREEASGSNTRLANNFTGTFNWASGTNYQSFVGDFNNDGFIDIGLRNINNGTWYFAFRTSSGFAFDNSENFTWVTGANYTPFIGDFNGDNLTDIGLRDNNNGVWYIRYKSSSTNYTYPTQVDYSWTPGSSFQPYVADFNGDGYFDIGMRDTSIGTFYLRLNDGTSNFTSEKTFTWATGANYTPVTGDFDGDGYGDIGLRNADNGKIYLRNGTSTYTFPNQDEYLFKTGSNYSAHVVGYNMSSLLLGSSSVSGVGLDNTLNEMHIYPNPASKEINIVTDKDVFSVILINMEGKEVLSYKNKKKIDISNIKPGLYFVKICYEWGEETQKVLVQ